jgi:hypothetical protein
MSVIPTISAIFRTGLRSPAQRKRSGNCPTRCPAMQAAAAAGGGGARCGGWNDCQDWAARRRGRFRGPAPRCGPRGPAGARAPVGRASTPVRKPPWEPPMTDARAGSAMPAGVPVCGCAGGRAGGRANRHARARPSGAFPANGGAAPRPLARRPRQGAREGRAAGAGQRGAARRGARAPTCGHSRLQRVHAIVHVAAPDAAGQRLQGVLTKARGAPGACRGGARVKTGLDVFSSPFLCT